MFNHGFNQVDIFNIFSLFMFFSMVPTILLPYQLSVVIRCLRLVKKGGQQYIVPEEDTRPVDVVEDGISMSVFSLESEQDQVRSLEAETHS